MQRIRAGTAADYETVLQRVLMSFSEANPFHPRFDELAPDVVRPDEPSMNQWLLAEVDGELAAGLQVVPRHLVMAGDVEVPVAGLANEMETPGRGQIKAMVTLAGNIGLSLPGSRRLAGLIQNLDYTV